MTATCETCQFYAVVTYTTGRCRRRAPIIRFLEVVTSAHRGYDHEPNASWPITEPDAWCGDYAPKPTERAPV